MRHLIAPSSMLGVALTSIHSSPQKGMRAQHPRLSRSRRDTPSLQHGHVRPGKSEAAEIHPTEPVGLAQAMAG
jgi:hypothetical protein